MLFENPAVAAKIPFPYNVPPPIQPAAAISNISNQIDNGFREHHELHNALVATINGNTAVRTPLCTNNKVVLNGTSTSISGSSGRSTPNNSDSAPVKLFVGGLSWQTSSEKLKEYFNMFGKVTDVLIMKDPLTQRSRGFGFITFQEASSVEKVLKVPIHTLDGKKIDPKHATPKNRPKQTNRTKKIFVGGVSQETSADEVKSYFGQFGKVEETVMLMDQQTKRHRGFGFVTFESEDVVDRVCEIHFHTIKNKKVECKKAQPKESVIPATQLLQKRLMLGTLGMRQLGMATPSHLVGPTSAVTAANPLNSSLTANSLAVAQAQAQAAVLHNQFQVQNTATAGFGKLLATYPPHLHSFRFTPYSIPASAASAAVAAAANQQQQTNPNPNPQGATAQQIAALASTPLASGNPYQGYTLANVDMSALQGIDWSSMYGMGMYV